MSDISVQCPKCGNQFSVSEYADQEKLICAKCGAAVVPPRNELTEESAAPKLRLCSVKPAQPAEQIPTAEMTITQDWMRRRQKNARRDSMRHHISLLSRINGLPWLNWVIFIILAGAGIYFRFLTDLPAEVQTGMRFWGSAALLACHVMIMISAYSDDMFQGMLCLLIPGYSLYYLFSISEEYFLRAITAALAIAFGLDAWQYLSVFGTDVFAGINRWIQSDGDPTNHF